MFQGRWPHILTIDAKSRLALPARIRDRLVGPEPKDLTIGVLQQKCLYIHNDDQHDHFLDRVFGHLGETRESRHLKSYVLSRFMPAAPDAQGRIIVPQLLLDRAAITRECVLLVQNARIEVWGAETLAAMEAEAEAGSIDDALEAVFAEEESEQRELRRLRRTSGPPGEGGSPLR